MDNTRDLARSALEHLQRIMFEEQAKHIRGTSTTCSGDSMLTTQHLEAEIKKVQQTLAEVEALNPTRRIIVLQTEEGMLRLPLEMLDDPEQTKTLLELQAKGELTVYAIDSKLFNLHDDLKLDITKL